MSKFKLILVAVGVLGALSVLVSYAVNEFRSGPDTTVPRPTEFPDGNTVPPVSTTVPGDVTTFPETTSLGDGFYQVTPLDPVVVTDFDILYNENNDSYAVALGREPLSETRQKAEQFLLDRLRMSEAELCSMNILVTTTYDVNQFLAGEDLGLSFCPGSLEL